jgi:hypothetical protein
MSPLAHQSTGHAAGDGSALVAAASNVDGAARTVIPNASHPPSGLPGEVWPVVAAAHRSEQPLLDRIDGGDRVALRQLYERYGWLVYGRARGITNEPLAAELITLGVFAKLWASPAEFPADQLAYSLTALAERRSTRWVYES